MGIKFHIALNVEDLEACVRDYSRRLGCEPSLVVPRQYALWRTEMLNFSIRCGARACEKLRHLGWEGATASAFSHEADVNGITWERFTAEHQRAEIESIWPDPVHAAAERTWKGDRA